jgi:hypothetical protein
MHLEFGAEPLSSDIIGDLHSLGGTPVSGRLLRV